MTLSSHQGLRESSPDVLAPIALFVYNRLESLQATVESLAKNDLSAQSDLFIFADGPKASDNPESIRQVRQYIRSIQGFRSVTIQEREHNVGLARAIIEGVTWVIAVAGQVIVLEDDLVSSPFFLKYMNEALKFYEKDERVISIHSYVFPVDDVLPETFFLRGTDCWGWATWARGWSLFEADGQKLLTEITRRKLRRQFDFGGTFPYTRMLEQQIEGKNDSWAIRWYASAFLAGKLTLYPGQSLTYNVGDFGTHCSALDSYMVKLCDLPPRIGGVAVEESRVARACIRKFFIRSALKAYWSKIVKLFHLSWC